MSTYNGTRLSLGVIAFLSIACALGLSGKLFAAGKPPSSSECIKCHTDLNKMDSYGAASAGGAAAIAG
jgi:hypothetical protein